MESKRFYDAVRVFGKFFELYDLQSDYCGIGVSLDLDTDDPMVVP